MNFISVWLFISFSLGIILGKYLHLGFFWLAFLCSLSLVGGFFAFRRKQFGVSDISLVLVFCLLGFIWIQPYNSNIPGHILGKQVLVCGKVSYPVTENKKFNSYYLRGNYIFYGKERVYVPGNIKIIDYSKRRLTFLDYWLFEGKIKRDVYRNNLYVLYVKKKDIPKFMRKSFDVRKVSLNVSNKLSGYVRSNFSPLVAGFLNGIFLGNRREIDKGIKNEFIQGGTSHLLAISGLHVGIIIWVMLFLLKLMNIKRRKRLVVSMIAILFYAFICGLRTPVLRAVVMFWCFALSFLLNRKFLVFNALAVAGLVNLFWRPENLFSVSFQFSFVAVLFIVLGTRYFYRHKMSGLMLWNQVKGLFFISLFANVGLLPLVSYYFGRIYLLNIVANIVLIPYLGLLLSSLSVFLIMCIISPLRGVLANSVSFLTICFLKINSFFANLPFSFLEYRFSRCGVFVYYLAILTVGSLIRIIYLRHKRASDS